MALSVSSVGSSTTASSVNGDGTEDGEPGGEPLTSDKLEKLNEATGSNVTPIPAGMSAPVYTTYPLTSLSSILSHR